MIVLILFNLSIFNDSQLGEKLSTLDVIGNENKMARKCFVPELKSTVPFMQHR